LANQLTPIAVPLVSAHLVSPTPPRHPRQQVLNRDMDGLSVAVSVVARIQVAAKVTAFLSAMAGASTTAQNVLAEAQDFQAILSQIRDFIIEFSEDTEDRRSMLYVNVNQLVVTLTGCVCAFADLESTLDGLKLIRILGFHLICGIAQNGHTRIRISVGYFCSL
jgi:hypothetical protein